MYWTSVQTPTDPVRQTFQPPVSSCNVPSRGWNPWDSVAGPISGKQPEIVSASDIDICRFYLEGHCRFGDECHNLHIKEGQDASEDPKALEKQLWHASRNRDADATCAICSEEVVAKGRRFGLLEFCSHVFCLDCIREWRRQKEQQDRLNLRRCPICRVESYIILPSDRVISGLVKITELEAYKQTLCNIPCKYVSKGQDCPFGTSCLYQHGPSPLPVTAPINFRLIKGADGRKKAVPQQKLCDYLGFQNRR